MSNFSAARKNMVDCQIHPSGVIDEKILEAFATIPRESYLETNQSPIAYQDEDIVMKDGRFILEPTIHARMIDALDLNPDSTILDIGHAGGYSSAILSSLVSTVIALEQKQKYITAAEKVWLEHDICNIVALKSTLSKGAPEHAPYPFIILNGSVAEIPQKLIDQLDINGKMVLILRAPDQIMGQVQLIQHLGEGKHSTMTLFEAAAPYLVGFEPAQSFNF